MEKSSFSRVLSQLLQPGPKERNVSPLDFPNLPRAPVKPELSPLWQHVPGVCWWAQLVLGAAAGGCSCASLAAALCWFPLWGVLQRVLIC